MTHDEANNTHTEVVAVEEPVVRRRSNVKMMLAGFAGLIGLLVVVAGGIGAYRAYAKNATDTFTLTVARILRLPALKVNGTTILYKDFADDLIAIHKMRDYDKQRGGPGAQFSDTDLLNQVIDRGVKNTLVAEAAATYKVTATDDEVTKFKDQVLQLQQLANDAEADKALNMLYGWNLDTYKRKIMYPLVLYKKTGDAVENDPKQITVLRDAAKARGLMVLDQLKNGADFTQLALDYSEDNSAQQGGELGWFSKDAMVPEFSNAAFTLKKGEYTQNLVETQYGFHIIQVEDTRVQKVKDPKTNKMVNQEQVQARHILIRPSIDRYLEKQLKTIDLHLYINAENPYKNG